MDNIIQVVFDVQLKNIHQSGVCVCEVKSQRVNTKGMMHTRIHADNTTLVSRDSDEPHRGNLPRRVAVVVGEGLSNFLDIIWSKSCVWVPPTCDHDTRPWNSLLSFITQYRHRGIAFRYITSYVLLLRYVIAVSYAQYNSTTAVCNDDKNSYDIIIYF